MLTALLALSPARRLLAGLAGAGVLMAAGAALTIAVEHRAPWGLEAKRAKLARQIDDPVTGLRAQLHAMTGDRDAWQGAEGRCAAARRKDNADASNAVEEASSARARANGSAFNQGYAAGRAVGLQTCGAPRDPEANPSPDGGPDAGGVRNDGTDLAASFERGAYRPGSSLPRNR